MVVEVVLAVDVAAAKVRILVVEMIARLWGVNCGGKASLDFECGVASVGCGWPDNGTCCCWWDEKGGALEKELVMIRLFVIGGVIMVEK